MSDPYSRTPLTLTDADRDAWADYEAANKRAADQYEALPIAHCRAGAGSPCILCRRRATRNKDGVCPTCKREEAS